ncbi:MAG: phosphocholine cytidylyltransferase family protein [Nanoarchaeota archaeon]
MNHTAIIFAAGKGVRLRPHTNTIPKCMLKVNGKTLIEYQVEACKQAGITEIIVIVGYKGEKIKRLLKDTVRYVWNNKFAETQTLYSLHLTQKLCQGLPVIHIDGDNYFEPLLIKKIIANPSQNVLLMEFRNKLDKEATKAVIQNKRLRYVSKDIPLDRASGESTGILKLSASLSSKLYEQARKSARQKRYELHVHDGLNQLLTNNVVRTMPCNESYWLEIDFKKDLARARTIASKPLGVIFAASLGKKMNIKHKNYLKFDRLKLTTTGMTQNEISFKNQHSRTRKVIYTLEKNQVG